MSEATVKRTTCARIPTSYGQFQLCHYIDLRTDKEHLALVYGDIAGKIGILTRVHSECFTGDVLGSLRCDCGEQLQVAMKMIAAAGAGLIIYLRQEGRGIGLENKLRAYNLQDQGFDTVDANLMLGHQADEREYSAAAAILQDQKVGSIQLLTNNPDKLESLQALGITIESRRALQPSVHNENAGYLTTKVQRMRHLLALPPQSPHKNGANGDEDAPGTSRDKTAPTDIPSVESGELDAPITAELARLEHYAEDHASRLQRPFVTLTYAQTLDGTIADTDGSPMRISGPESMRMTHALRTRHDAILVGIGTVLQDNPRLTARLVAGNQPQPVILDTHLRTPPHASLYQHPKGVWLASHLNGRAKAAQDDARTYPPQNARVLDIPLDGNGRLDLAALLTTLGQMGIRRVMVEGGSTVINSFLRSRLVDYIVVTIAPRYAGGRHLLSTDTVGDDSTPASAALPGLNNVGTVSAGKDTILWGVPCWTDVPTEEHRCTSAATVAAPANITFNPTAHAAT
ncbi:MAG: GTP cyclohydrolase II [Litorilinea sp.]